MDAWGLVISKEGDEGDEITSNSSNVNLHLARPLQQTVKQAFIHCEQLLFG
jgi:hypothetical protein